MRLLVFAFSLDAGRLYVDNVTRPDADGVTNGIFIERRRRRVLRFLLPLIDVVDGRYTYFCYPKDMLDQEFHQYTLMPLHMTNPAEVKNFHPVNKR